MQELKCVAYPKVKKKKSCTLIGQKFHTGVAIKGIEFLHVFGAQLLRGHSTNCDIYHFLIMNVSR
jgi:hypothetical protein